MLRSLGARLLGGTVDRSDVAVIAEVKKSSPSEGAIAPDCEASKQALHYQDGGAAAISVLTEPEYFGGSFTDLSDVADAVDVPVLCKDFVVDPVQLFVARGHGADAVLLMVSVLGDSVAEYVDFATRSGCRLSSRSSTRRSSRSRCRPAPASSPSTAGTFTRSRSIRGRARRVVERRRPWRSRGRCERDLDAGARRSPRRGGCTRGARGHGAHARDVSGGRVGGVDGRGSCRTRER